MKKTTILLAAAFFVAAVLTRAGSAEDWPAWRGARGDAVWKEEGILKRFPADGLEVRWRTPVLEGYAGPAVAGGVSNATPAARMSWVKMPPNWSSRTLPT